MEPSGTPPFKDRRVGLVIFGVLQILLGGLCALLVPLLFVLAKWQAQVADAPADYRMFVPSAVLYSVIAVTLVWLGIGSILSRRWARTLILFVAWTWLIVGIVGTAAIALLLPQLMTAQRELDGPSATVGLVVILVFVFTIYVAAPAALVLFYRSPHVRATCEARDPVVRWTDSCPFPVLGGALSFALGALSLLFMPLTYGSIFPLFGVVVTGPLAIVLIMGTGLLWAWLAWGIFRMRGTAWTASIVVIVVLGLSATITMMRADMLELYRSMGFPEQQIEQMAQLGIPLGATTSAVTAISTLLLLGYMLWIKKYFRTPLVTEIRRD